MLLCLALGLSLLQGGAPAQQRCAPGEQTLDTLSRRFTTLDVLWAQLEEERFTAELARLKAQIPCLRERLDPRDAAELHMWMAFDAFAAGGRDSLDRAELELRAAVGARPGFSLPDALLAEGHPLRDRFVAALAHAPPARTPIKGKERILYFDGTRTDDRPTDVPTVVQVLDAEGRVLATWYLGVNERLPDLSVYPLAGADRGPEEDEPQARVPSPSRLPTSRAPLDGDDDKPATREGGEGTRREDRPLEFGLSVGNPTGLRVGVRGRRWNDDGGFGLDELGLSVAGVVGLVSGTEPGGGFDAALYADWDLKSAPWQLHTGLGGGMFCCSGYGAAVELRGQWDPPDRQLQVDLGLDAHLGEGVLIAPVAAVGWSW